MSLLKNKAAPEVRETQMTKSALEEEKRIAINLYQKDNRKQNISAFKEQKEVIESFASLPQEDHLKALDAYILEHDKSAMQPRVGMHSISINAVELAMIKRAMVASGERSIRSLILSATKL